MKFIKALFRLPNWVTLLTIALGVVASAGLTEKYYPNEKVLLALVTLIAAQLLVDRLGVLSSISNAVNRRSEDYSVELLPRTSPQFERFSDFVRDSSEVLVVGVDLGFMATADAWFIKEAVNNGLNLKLLISDPNTTGELADRLNMQDERNVRGEPLAHDHPATAGATLRTLKSLVPATARGRLEIRARADIPSPSLTMVDPTKRDGKIRVEIKLYKRNQGEVPYFTLTRSSVWYQMFFEHYYSLLWEDSEVLYTSKP
ncbi:hypothetical protein AB0J83_48050 [Actinoplanes sp. NPDC049596]|uniref:hypothetical protein n=1 Tax=unclassified Actinoplanes TaxID=2626549 RepID=UPI003432555C